VSTRLGAGLFIAFILIASALQAQRTQYGRLKGTVIDSTENNPLEAATISVFLSSDSSLVSYALTGKKGEFVVNDIPRATNCWLLISFNGYNPTVRSFRIPSDKQELDLRSIKIDKSFRELGQVTVVAQKPPVVIRQDTIEFNVGSFVTRPNGMIEDVLKQMPGVEIEPDGTVTINGKKVSKVTLDGKEFFGGDPKIALKNLPKDIIDKIQVTDNRSRESRFNKTKTGNEDLSINLTIRKDKSKGWFGMAGAGYGTDNRHEGFANINYFNGARQLNFIGNANNTNRGNYSGENFNIGNSSGTLGGGGQGIVRSQAAGVNFSENSSERFKLNGSYFYNRGDVENLNKLQRQNILPDTSFFYNAVNKTENEYDNHRLSVNIGYNPDTLTELYLNASFDRDKMGMVTANDASSKGASGGLINTSANTFITDGSGWRASGEFFVGRRFRKRGRGITFNMSYGYNDQPVDEKNKGENVFYKDDTLDSREDIDQLSHTSNVGYNTAVNVNYSEPILENFTLHLRHNYQSTKNESDKVTNRFNPVTGEYDIKDSLFTNAFRSTISSHTPGINLVFLRNKFHWSLGAGLQFLSQDNVTLQDEAMLKQEFINFTPSASLGYNFSKTFNVEVYYSGRNQQPSIQQLQPVPDNRNPLYVVLGNPDLQPSFYHNVHMSIRQTSGTSFWHGSFSVNSIMRQIINETYFDEFGRQVSRPVNVNGNYNMSWNLQYSKSWKRRDLSVRVNVGNRGNYSRNATFTNKIKNNAEVYSLSPMLGLNLTWKQLLSIQPTFHMRYNFARYSVSTIQDIDYNTKRLNVSMFWNYPKRLIIENSLQYNYNSRTAPGFRKGVAMWSAAANWQLFDKQQANIRLAVYDILKQNLGIQRIITQTYIEDNQAQVLQQYFILSFIYNLRRFGE
jgi:hypothetical protein